jgi:hypothetical protein
MNQWLLELDASVVPCELLLSLRHQRRISKSVSFPKTLTGERFD